MPAARDAEALPLLELQAHEQIRRQRSSPTGITLPNRLFEQARLHRFMREAFETVADGRPPSPGPRGA